MKPRYNAIDISTASNDKPLLMYKQRRQLLAMHLSLEEMERGQSPSKADWDSVASAINMLEALIGMGECQDPDNLLDDARAALGRSIVRRFRLNGTGLTAVRAVLEDYAQIMSVTPARTMLAAHRRAELKLIEEFNKNRAGR